MCFVTITLLGDGKASVVWQGLERGARARSYSEFLHLLLLLLVLEPGSLGAKKMTEPSRGCGKGKQKRV